MIFLKCTNVRFSESKLINFEMWKNLLEIVFMPILLLLLLIISNFSCLLVHTTLLSSEACSDKQLSKISIKFQGILVVPQFLVDSIYRWFSCRCRVSLNYSFTLSKWVRLIDEVIVVLFCKTSKNGEKLPYLH